MLYIIPTIDTENPQTLLRNGVVKENLIEPEFGGQRWGPSRLSSIFLKYNIKAVFFLASSEKQRFSFTAYKKLAQYLDAAGHEVAVHSHPEWMVSNGKIHMWQLTQSEQQKVLCELIDDIKRWTGRSPVSHRAGAYGINEDTLTALQKTGICIDSSMYAEHKNCKVWWSYNQVVEKDGILEIPVTGFYRVDRLKIGNFRFKLRKHFVKTDLHDCSTEDLLWFVNYAIRSGIKVMNLFMHSYSLIHIDKLPDVVPNVEVLKRLETFLDMTKEFEQVRYVTLREFAKIHSQLQDQHIGNDWIGLRYKEYSALQVLRKIFAC